MEGLALIGICTVCYMFYIGLIKPKAEDKQLEKEHHKKLVAKIKWRDPKVKAFFDRHSSLHSPSKSQREMQYIDEYITGNRYRFYDLYGQSVSATNKQHIDDLKAELDELLKNILNDSAEREKYEKLVKIDQNNKALQKRQKELSKLRKNELYLKYDDCLTQIYYNSRDAVSRTTILNHLQAYYASNSVSANDLFTELTDIHEGILSLRSSNKTPEEMYSYDRSPMKYLV